MEKMWRVPPNIVQISEMKFAWTVLLGQGYLCSEFWPESCWSWTSAEDCWSVFVWFWKRRKGSGRNHRDCCCQPSQRVRREVLQLSLSSWHRPCLVLPRGWCRSLSEGVQTRAGLTSSACEGENISAVVTSHHQPHMTEHMLQLQPGSCWTYLRNVPSEHLQHYDVILQSTERKYWLKSNNLCQLWR